MNQDHKFIPGVVPPSGKSEPSWWFAFQGDKLLVHLETDRAGVPSLIDFAELGLPAASKHYLGRLDDRHCYAVELAEGDPPPAGMAFKGLRQVYGLLMKTFSGWRAERCRSWSGTEPISFAAGVGLK